MHRGWNQTKWKRQETFVVVGSQHLLSVYRFVVACHFTRGVFFLFLDRFLLMLKNMSQSLSLCWINVGTIHFRSERTFFTRRRPNQAVIISFSVGSSVNHRFLIKKNVLHSSIKISGDHFFLDLIKTFS